MEGQGLTLEGDDLGKVWMPVESLQQTFLWAPPPVAVDVALDMKSSTQVTPVVSHFCLPQTHDSEMVQSTVERGGFSI